MRSSSARSLLASWSLVTFGSLATMIACGPPAPATSPTAASASATTAATAPPTMAPTTTTVATTAPTATAAPTATTSPTSALPTTFPTSILPFPPLPFPLPSVGVPTFPVSPRAALVGVWKVAAIDGKPIGTAPGMVPNPLDPTSYLAGATVTFTATDVSAARAGIPVWNHAYKVLSEIPPVRVVIDVGFGASNVDFTPDGSALWSLASVPPHAVSLVH